MFHMQINDNEGIPAMSHRSMTTKGAIIGAYVVASIRQSGISVFMVVSIETLDNVAEQYLWTANHRLGMTRDEVLEATAVRIFLADRLGSA